METQEIKADFIKPNVIMTNSIGQFDVQNFDRYVDAFPEILENYKVALEAVTRRKFSKILLNCFRGDTILKSYGDVSAEASTNFNLVIQCIISHVDNL